MFCFPQMGIISLFGSQADSSGSRRGAGGGRPGAAGSSRGADAAWLPGCLGDNPEQVGISICAMEERAVGQWSSVMGTPRAHLAVSPLHSCLMSVLKSIQPSPCSRRGDQSGSVLRAPSPSLGRRPWLPHPTALTGPASDSEPGMRASPTHELGAGGVPTHLGVPVGRPWVSTQGLVQLSISKHLARRLGSGTQQG